MAGPHHRQQHHYPIQCWSLAVNVQSYRLAAASGGPKLRGRRAQSVWDPELTRAMLALGIKIEEERVLRDLLNDLSSTD
ncbi:MAG: DUF2399 domain-containing protein [Chloroflexota bacterium]